MDSFGIGAAQGVGLAVALAGALTTLGAVLLDQARGFVTWESVAVAALGRRVFLAGMALSLAVIFLEQIGAMP